METVFFKVLCNIFSGLFQQALLFSGTDMVPWAVNEPWVSVNITRQIAEDVECPTTPSQTMVDCLRSRTTDDVMDAFFLAPVRKILPLCLVLSGINTKTCRCQ